MEVPDQVSAPSATAEYGHAQIASGHPGFLLHPTLGKRPGGPSLGGGSFGLRPRVVRTTTEGRSDYDRGSLGLREKRTRSLITLTLFDESAGG